MTSREFARICELWNDGVPAKQIAHEVHYSTQSIYHLAHMHRDMFPRRHCEYGSCTESEKAEWAQRIRNGESTISNAVRQTGYNRGTVRKWLWQYA